MGAKKLPVRNLNSESKKTKGILEITLCVRAYAVAQLCLTLCDPMDCGLPGFSLSTEFSRQEYWSGLPFLPPEDLPDPGIKPASLASPALADVFFTTAPPLGNYTILTIIC